MKKELGGNQVFGWGGVCGGKGLRGEGGGGERGHIITDDSEQSSHSGCCDLTQRGSLRSVCGHCNVVKLFLPVFLSMAWNCAQHIRACFFACIDNPLIIKLPHPSGCWFHHFCVCDVKLSV